MMDKERKERKLPLLVIILGLVVFIVGVVWLNYLAHTTFARASTVERLEERVRKLERGTEVK